MARCTHGVSAGNWYFEVLVLDHQGGGSGERNASGSSAAAGGDKDKKMTFREVVEHFLPKGVRFGEGLRKDLKAGILMEEEEKLVESTSSNSFRGGNEASDSQENRKKKRRIDNSTSNNSGNLVGVGNSGSNSSNGNNGRGAKNCKGKGHLRIGWSMRTAELQAPVGYDRWSYGLRDIMGSRVHNSRREDHWSGGGEGFGPGDVVGFAICLTGDSSNMAAADSQNHSSGGASGSTKTNHIRFFKNGESLGHFIVTRGIRTGGAAFDPIQPGTYYPAISSYMGGAARVNFGPHFIYPPRKNLPSGMKIRPLSEVCSPPLEPEEVMLKFKKERIFGKRTDDALVNAFWCAVKVEAEMRFLCWENFIEKHIKEVREGRIVRGMSTGDLPEKKIVLEEEVDEENKIINRDVKGGVD